MQEVSVFITFLPGYFDLLEELELFIKHPFSKLQVIATEGLKRVDKTSNLSLTIELFLQPDSGQPISCVRVIFASHLCTDINHGLHAGSYCFLHSQGVSQGLSYGSPGVLVEDWLHRFRFKEIIAVVTSHSQIFNEGLSMFPLFISMFPEHSSYSRKMIGVLRELSSHQKVLKTSLKLHSDLLGQHINTSLRIVLVILGYGWIEVFCVTSSSDHITKPKNNNHHRYQHKLAIHFSDF